ncbi:hypothetical protein FIBSPDRAFT_859417 [Athelia psychrophila]|uniref:Uncharacterized protein n=1 Tax=Athelia psychrophila TaxID=1759441 RepID=A0A166L788_9AGAM|nr:hypothetical protein FIBSPDRAFT_859417 [Fibularhizoctonia sp. CBS 109695]
MSYYDTSNIRGGEVNNVGGDQVTARDIYYNVSCIWNFSCSIPAVFTSTQPANGSPSTATRDRGSEERLEDSESIVVTGSLVSGHPVTSGCILLTCRSGTEDVVESLLRAMF